MYKKVIAFIMAVMMMSSAVYSASAYEENNSYKASSNAVAFNTIKINCNEGDDIAQSLQDAFDAAHREATDSNPFTIIIPSGTYEISKPLRIFSNTTVKAYGAEIKKCYNEGSMIRTGYSDTISYAFDGYKNITFEGGNWNGNCFDERYNKNSFCNMRICHTSNFQLINVTVSNNNGSHHIELGGVKGVNITGCTFTGQLSDLSAGGQEAIQLDVLNNANIFSGATAYDDSACEDVFIYNNNFKNIYRGIGNHSAVLGKYFNNINIYNNTFEDLDDWAIYTNAWKNSKIYNNVINNTACGIDIKHMNASNYFLNSAESQPGTVDSDANIEIYDNIINISVNSANLQNKIGIRIRGENVTKDTNNQCGVPLGVYTIENVNIHNNIIGGKLKYGIRTEYADKCKITNNSIDEAQNSNGAANSRGISLYESNSNNINNNSISNILSDGSNGIMVESNCNNNIIAGNNISNISKIGISVRDSKSNTLNNNRIENTVERGINVSTCSDMKITENTLIDTTGMTINTGSSVSVLKDNTVVNNKDNNSIYINPDSTAPISSLKKASVEVSKTKGDSISGSTVSNQNVYVWDDITQIGSSKSDKSGKFTVKYTVPLISSTLYAGYQDSNGNRSVGSFYYHIEPKGISFDKGAEYIKLRTETKLTPSLYPSGASTTYKWTSNNPEIAEVDSNGKVFAKSSGVAVITATTENGYSASCQITVYDGYDVNGDGVVSINDVTYIQKVLVGIEVGRADIEIIGDVNNDGKFDISDATEIQKRLVGLS